MDIAIISSGSELVAGELVDTNSAWLSEQLTALGGNVLCHLTVGDDRRQLRWVCQEAANRCDLAVMTGGLGPTTDDLTRFILAELAGVELEERRELLEALEAFFKQRGRTMSPANRVQVLMPKGSTALPNVCGTAPGIQMPIGRAMFFALPGVPREMKEMYLNSVKPWVCERTKPDTHRVRLMCTGIGESNIMHEIRDLVGEERGIVFGTRASEGIIAVKLAGPDPAVLAEIEGQIRGRLGEAVFGADEDTLEEVVGRMLRERRWTLAVAESCTGGLVAERITAVAGSSDYFLGGWVTYANAFKERFLGVPAEILQRYGAVSEPCARAMLEGLLRTSGADWGIAVTGIAGPSGGSEEKPVGLVYIAAGSRRVQETREYRLGSLGRDVVRHRAALTALNQLRLLLRRS